jgi:phage baseplate assembly protein gpV
MSRKFLTNLDLNTNELLNAVIQNLATDPGSGEAGQVYYNTADSVLKIYNGSASAWQAVGSVEYIGDTVADLLEGGDGIYLDYDDANDTLTIQNIGVRNIAGTANQIALSAASGSVTVSLPDAIIIGDTTTDGSLTIQDGSATSKIVLNSAASATFDVNTVIGGATNSTLTVKDSSASAKFTVDPADKVTSELPVQINDTTTGLIVGAGGSVLEANSTELEISVFTDLNASLDVQDNLTVGASAYFADDLAVQGDVSIQGNLNVLGNVNSISTTEISLEDNSILLNSTLSASVAPSVDASINVNRGSSADVAIRWNESNDKWELTNDGSNYYDIVATDNLTEDVQDIVGGLIGGSNSLEVTYTDGTDSLTLDTILQTASPSYLVKASGLAVDLPTLETQLITDSFARKAAANVGNGSNTAFALVHNFGTRDVTVNVYDSSTYETVETDVVRTDSNTVTVSFASAPSNDAYRVVIVG